MTQVSNGLGKNGERLEFKDYAGILQEHQEKLKIAEVLFDRF